MVEFEILQSGRKCKGIVPKPDRQHRYGSPRPSSKKEIVRKLRERDAVGAALMGADGRLIARLALKWWSPI